MNNHHEQRYSSKELSEKLTEHIRELAEATDIARMSEEMQSFLDITARFHRYSSQNVWLIHMARPDATFVAGFKKWRTLGRYVRKGEQGIPILAPILVKPEDEDGDDEGKLVGFKVVYVFDVSQTDGEPLPEPPDWKSPEKNYELGRKLVKFAKSKGIQVHIKDLEREIQGASIGGEIYLSPKAGTKTIIHEIAHELMHQGDERKPDKSIMELEAESVAYVVAKYFCMDGLASPNYVALHGADAGLVLAHLERIRKTAKQIINALN